VSTPEVKVGRRLRVLEVVSREKIASLGPHAAQVEPFAVVADSGGRQRRIKLRRFRPTSTGYRLVEDTR
jgi:hypothetical protein